MQGAQEDGGSISLVLNRTLLALWRKSNRMINAGRPERNTCTEVHSKVTRAWSRAQMQGGEKRSHSNEKSVHCNKDLAQPGKKKNLPL